MDHQANLENSVDLQRTKPIENAQIFPHSIYYKFMRTLVYCRCVSRI